jgi:hypothetical protein
MLGSTARHRVLGSLAVLGALLGFSLVEARQNAYDDAIGRALRLLPRQPEKIVLVDRASGPHLHEGKPRTEAFVNRGGRVVYLVRQGVTLQAALKGPGIFDYALATVIWHEMAHIDGADEAAAQLAEEQLWTEFVLAQRVDRRRGMQYLALLKKRR